LNSACAKQQSREESGGERFVHTLKSKRTATQKTQPPRRKATHEDQKVLFKLTFDWVGRQQASGGPLAGAMIWNGEGRGGSPRHVTLYARCFTRPRLTTVNHHPKQTPCKHIQNHSASHTHPLIPNTKNQGPTTRRPTPTATTFTLTARTTPSPPRPCPRCQPPGSRPPCWPPPPRQRRSRPPPLLMRRPASPCRRMTSSSRLPRCRLI
jgi:hypothetical protein